MKPPWTDQGWSLVAGALANRGVHPPPTTSRPSLPSRCGCTPDCLRSPPPLSRDSSLSLFPFLDSYARGLQGYRRNAPLAPHASSLARSRYRRPSCRTTSSEADLPRGQPLRQRRRSPTPESRHGKPPPPLPPPARACPRRLSYAATAITFAGKSSGAVGEPGLTLQGAVVRPR